jgi:hypothetical protein
VQAQALLLLLLLLLLLREHAFEAGDGINFS